MGLLIHSPELSVAGGVVSGALAASLPTLVPSPGSSDLLGARLLNVKKLKKEFGKIDLSDKFKCLPVKIRNLLN